VIDAGEVLAVSGVVEADQCAAVHAAVFERCNSAGFGSHNDHRHPADEGRAPVAGIGDLGFEAEIVPYGTFEQKPLLLVQEFGVLIDVKGNLAQPFGP